MMSRSIDAEYGQCFLLPPSLEEWVGPEHPARFVRDFVDGLDLDWLGAERGETAEAGRPHYAPRLLLCLWLYGYMERIRSPRALERACRNHMGFIWLSGMLTPDHNTLWRFWKAHKGGLKEVFRQSVRVAAALELVEMVVHCVDGTKIASAASKRRALHRSDLEALLASLDERLSSYMETVDEAGTREESEGGYGLPDELRDAAARKAKIAEVLERLDIEGRARVLPGDPDARMMRGSGRTEWSYNAQAVVDKANGFVVASAVTSDENDRRQLVPMLEETVNTLGETAETTLADGGYNSNEQLGAAHAKGYNVLVNSHGQEKRGGTHYPASRFVYDRGQDVYVCPQGAPLPYEYTDDNNGKPRRVYRCRRFAECPVRAQCSAARRGRTIKRDLHADAVEEHLTRRETPENKTLLRERGAVIERIFGAIKHNEGFRRWTVRGIGNANAQWDLICTAWNLKLLHRLVCAKPTHRSTPNPHPDPTPRRTRKQIRNRSAILPAAPIPAA